jgi:DNA-nicking Smr family endonuclease
MDFGDILDEWERETAKPYGKKRLAANARREGPRGDESPESAKSADGEKNSGGESSASRGVKSRGEKSRGVQSHQSVKPIDDVSTRRVNPMELWLRQYGVEDKDTAAAGSPERESPAERRRRLHAAKCDAVIDLHGLTRDDAWARLESFFADAVRRGLEKVLIIHGKGTHSAEDPVLGPMVRLFLEQHRHAGESGYSAKESGGAGSTWVILK